MTQSSDERLLHDVAAVAREEHLELLRQDLDDPAFAELSPEELQRLASAVTDQLQREPAPAPEPALAAMERRQASSAARGLGLLRRRWTWLAAAAALFGGGLWLAEQAMVGHVAQRAPAVIDTRQLTLPDGSTLALGEQTQARVVTLDPREVRVQLERGSVECDVARRPERRFVVATGALEVVVKGTRFSVSAGLEATAPEQVVVSVERGLVEVRQPPDRVLALLGAGQRWSSDGRPLPPEEVATQPTTDAAAQPNAARRDEAQPVEAPPTAQPEPGETNAATSLARPRGAPTSKPPAPTLAPAGPPPSSSPAPAAPPPTTPPAPSTSSRPIPTARELFERADAARVAGRSRQAAAALEELLRRHPDDARAGYAAFLLGRIRLDTLTAPAAPPRRSSARSAIPLATRRPSAATSSSRTPPRGAWRRWTRPETSAHARQRDSSFCNGTPKLSARPGWHRCARRAERAGGAAPVAHGFQA